LTSPPTAERADGAGGEAIGLTPRELEVLGLLAKGLTNRQIADALVICVKTVGIPVSQILCKPDVPARVEAARSRTGSPRIGPTRPPGSPLRHARLLGRRAGVSRPSRQTPSWTSCERPPARNRSASRSSIREKAAATRCMLVSMHPEHRGDHAGTSSAPCFRPFKRMSQSSGVGRSRRIPGFGLGTRRHRAAQARRGL
jgi:DNA-binding CsgD family transcriptional regulator